MNLGPTELLMLLVLIAVIVVPVIGLIDIVTCPDDASSAAGYSKTPLVVVQAVALLLPIVALIVAIVWYAAIRPKVRASGA